MSNTSQKEGQQIRKVQALQGERSFLLVLPKSMAVALGISKGDYVKCRVQDGALVVKKSEE
jgi:antitoxin component of MazEF toxin-antitoxin module